MFEVLAIEKADLFGGFLGDSVDSFIRLFSMENLALLIAAAIVILLVLASRQKQIAGKVRVIDGDSIMIDGKNCRLFGIDAPEMTEADGRRSVDGRRSMNVLSNLVSGATTDGKLLRYRVRGTCRYGRPLVIIFGDGVNLNAKMVRCGYARAYLRYSRAYFLHQMWAFVTRKGLWRTGFFWHPQRSRQSS
jgi:endonuclease YncB( thermonuclease family)